MSIKVAINGFGRIGRLLARHLKARDGFDLVAINDLTSPDMLGYLFGVPGGHRADDDPALSAFAEKFALYSHDERQKVGHPDRHQKSASHRPE